MCGVLSFYTVSWELNKTFNISMALLRQLSLSHLCQSEMGIEGSSPWNAQVVGSTSTWHGERTLLNLKYPSRLLHINMPAKVKPKVGVAVEFLSMLKGQLLDQAITSVKESGGRESWWRKTVSEPIKNRPDTALLCLCEYVAIGTLTLALTCTFNAVSATCWGSFTWLFHLFVIIQAWFWMFRWRDHTKITSHRSIVWFYCS